MRQVVLNNPESYSANNVCGRVKLYEVVDGFGNSTKVLGTWELLIANLLNDKNIKWTNDIVGFPYHWEDSIHLYFPDFYLSDLDIYIEVKGYQREKDEAKWNGFPHTLYILKEREIKILQETQDIEKLFMARSLSLVYSPRLISER